MVMCLAALRSFGGWGGYSTCVDCGLKISRRCTNQSVAQAGKDCGHSKQGGIPKSLEGKAGFLGVSSYALKENSVGRQAKAEKRGVFCSEPGRNLCVTYPLPVF